MFSFGLISVAIPLLMAVVVVVVVLVVVRATTAPKTYPGSATPPGQWPRSSWQAAVGRPFVGWVSPTRGRIEVYDGWVAWIPDGHDQPEWTVAARDLQAHLTMTGGGEVAIESEQTGKLHLSVSDQKVSVWGRGTPRDIHQLGLAHAFLAQLAQSGARTG